MSEQSLPTTLPDYTPALPGFRAEEFLALTETLLAFPIEQDQAALDMAPFRLHRPEPRPEPPFAPLPPRWYPRPPEPVIEAARASLVPPPRPAVIEGRANELARILRPLLAGHPVTVCGEPGVGKTTLLAHIAYHERTRQRFRRIWWIDQPARLDHTLALVLNLPHVLAEADPERRRAWLAEHLDDHTLLVIDNALPGSPALEDLTRLTPHILLAIETAPGIPEPGQPPEADPEGVITLRALDDTAAVDMLAHIAGISDTRRLRGQLLRIVTALGHHPYAIKLAGLLAARDGLSLDALEETLALDHLLAALQAEALRGESVASDADDAGDMTEPVYLASLNRALDVSVEALPRDYRKLYDAFGIFPPEGAPLDGLAAISRIGSPLAVQRGLIMLEQYGFIQRDHRDPERWVMHPVAHARAVRAHGTQVALSESAKMEDTAPQDGISAESEGIAPPAGEPISEPAAGKTGKAMRQWALRYARDNAGDLLALYRAETSLIAALHDARTYGPASQAESLAAALRPYLREVAPGLVGDPGDFAGDDPASEGDPAGDPRAEAAHLLRSGLDLTDQGAVFAAEEALQRALTLRQAHDSQHAVAEALVALARLYETQDRLEEAADRLIKAAEIVFKLGADPSLSVIRRALARVYRRMGRFAEALEVLDDAPEARLERAAVLRAQGDYAAAVNEMGQSGEARPYQRAEAALLAGHYDDALSAIEGQADAESALLRAQVYHLQGSKLEGAYAQAIESYRAALERAGDDDRLRAKALRGLGAALASIGEFDAAREAFEEALLLQMEDDPPIPLLMGRGLRLLAAVHLATGRAADAIITAREALSYLKQANSPADTADAYQTLGRALWREGDFAGALDAFDGEAQSAQSAPEHDDARISIALHHLADAHRATGSLDRAIANYRRALTHKKPAIDPRGTMITMMALHRALMEADRLPAALETAQEIVDHLVAQPRLDIRAYGFAQAIRARTQQAAQRPIRAQQSLSEWTGVLTTRAQDVLSSDQAALHVLLLGLAVRSLLAEKRPALALPLAEKSRAVATRHYPDSPAAWAAVRDLGEVLVALDRYREALNTLEELLIEPVESVPATYALARTLCGQACHQLGDPNQALIHWQSAFEHEPENRLKALLQERMAGVYLAEGDPSTAVEHLRMAIELLDRSAHPDDAARVLTTLARTLGGMNRYAEAIGVYEEALIVLRDVPDVAPTHTADVLYALGQTHEAQGQRDEAARVYRRALNLLERADAPRQSRDILHQLARVTAAMGDQSAVALYEQTRAATEQWGDSVELGQVYCELADVHRDAGRLTAAVQNYLAALNGQPAPPFLRERINTLRNLGRAYAQMERYDDARDAWEEALALSATLPEQSPLEIALTHHAIGEAHRSQGHLEEAVLSFREALRHHTPKTVEAAATWRALGQALGEDGRHADAVQALRYALEAEKIQPQQANARLVQTLRLLADAHAADGDIPRAIARHHETLVYMDRQLQPVAYADTLRTLGSLYRESGQFAEAHTAFEEALEIETTIAPRSDERTAATLQAIADTYRAQNNLQRAAEYYQKVTVYVNLARRATQDLRETLDELERRRATLQAAQQSLALLDRSETTDFKDVITITALIAHSHDNLNDPAARDEAIESLIGVLRQHQDKLDTNAQGDARGMAFLLLGVRAQAAGETEAAQQALSIARDGVRNEHLRWVIERVMAREVTVS